MGKVGEKRNSRMKKIWPTAVLRLHDREKIPRWWWYGSKSPFRRDINDADPG